MPPTYNIGSSTDQIKLTVNISADALAATTVNLLTIPSHGNLTEITTSDDATGDINGKLIGDHTVLKGKRIQVFTKVSITGSDEEQRKKIADNVTATYTLANGEEGEKDHVATANNMDYVDPNLFINFLIDPK